MRGERDNSHYDRVTGLVGIVVAVGRKAFGAYQESLGSDTGEAIRLRVTEEFLRPQASCLPDVVEIEQIDGGILSLNTRSGSLSIRTGDVDRELGDRAWYDHAHRIVGRLVVIFINGESAEI